MEDISKKFEAPIIRKDFEAVSREVKEKIEAAPEAGPVPGRQAVSEALKPKVYTQTSSEDSQLPHYVASAPVDVRQKVEELVILAFREGIDKAAKKAQKESPFVLDAFHDTLVDRFYEELKKRKIVQ